MSTPFGTTAFAAPAEVLWRVSGNLTVMAALPDGDGCLAPIAREQTLNSLRRASATDLATQVTSSIEDNTRERCRRVFRSGRPAPLSLPALSSVGFPRSSPR